MSRSLRNAVKEAVDHLPSGVCFFDTNGMLTLCNYQMHRIIYDLTGRDLQSLSELSDVLEGHTPVAHRDHDIFILDDGSAWQFAREPVTTRAGSRFTQVIAGNVTELYHRQKELEEDNRRLEEYAERMRRLSANIITLIREEEILAMKMRVHDDIGRSVIATRQFIQQKRPMEELDLSVWKNAIRLLKHDNESGEGKEDTLAAVSAAAESLNIRIHLEGELPEDKEASELLIAAIRECMTNAVRHAGADRLYVTLTADDHMASVVITNNGAVPEGEIIEGGGLSSLRVRVRQKGGTMRIRNTPGFILTVSIPVGNTKERHGD